MWDSYMATSTNSTFSFTTVMDKAPLLHLKCCMGTQWKYSSNLMGVYFDVSIGIKILKGLLSGSAHIIVTTSCYSHATVEYYQELREFSSISVAVVLLLLSFPSTKAPNRMSRHLLTTFTQHWDSILTILFHLLLFLRMATRSMVWMPSLSSHTVSCL